MTTGPAHQGWRGVIGLRVIALWGPVRTMRVVAAIALGVGMAWVIANSHSWVGAPTTWIADTQYYFGAGERLDAGHLLYAYSPGDRPLTVDPFAFAGPFLYPPLLGVLWRPLALLPYEPTVIAWWAAGLVTFLSSLVWLLRHGGIPVAIGTLLLLVPLVETAWSGNVSTFLTPLIIWTWLALARGHDRAAGAAIGLATVLKLTPGFLAWWLIVERRWSAVRSAVAAGVVGIVVSLVGAGPGAYGDYLRVSGLVARTGGTEASLSGILRGMGASPDVLALVAPIVAVVGIAAIAALRDRPRLAWGSAVVAGVFASPVFNLTNVTLLLAAFVAGDSLIGPPRAAPARIEREQDVAPVRRLDGRPET